jgi:hypothetical protein
MSLRTEYTRLSPRFDAFLFAPIGEEASGSTLTVVSALARAGFDPWKEAERLSTMRRGAGAIALGAMLAPALEGEAEADDPELAGRLLALLPAPGSAEVRTEAAPPEFGLPLPPGSLLWIALSATAVFLFWSMGGF